jgi:hypothetical protein
MRSGRLRRDYEMMQSESVLFLRSERPKEADLGSACVWLQPRCVNGNGTYPGQRIAPRP